jgi:hypothetical protein
MPVVSVFVPAALAAGSLLSEVADAVADGLDLGAGDVISVLVPTGATAVSGVSSDAAPWIIVTIQGSHRRSEKMAQAREAAEAAVRFWAGRNGIDIGGVWTQWQTPVP